MKNPLELKLVGSNRVISSLRLWMFRIYMFIAIPNALMQIAVTSGPAGLVGGLLGVIIVSYGILYLLSNSRENEVPGQKQREQPAD